MAAPAPARYFPVRKTPFRFQAGLHPFGTDFGNGVADLRYFQVDAERAAYLQAKRAVNPARHATLARDADERAAHATVLPWIHETFRREHPALSEGVAQDYRALSLALQEDLVVLHRGADGRDAAIMVDVSFPSDWSPERIIGTDFRFIHGPVPGFADTEAQAASLASAMIDRGPYVRFVWTLAADDFLDHHPTEGRRRPWSADGHGYLRVERQVTAPFPQVQAALFLIRTYLYPLATLTPEQRAILRQAIATMPADAARYKNFVAPREVILALLA